MEIVKNNQKRTITPLPSVLVHEYDMRDPDLGGATAELNGRDPEKGFITNEITKELVYVLSGSGKIITPDKETALSEGDMVLIKAGEVYAWLGKMTLFMANTPKFDPQQHKTIL